VPLKDGTSVLIYKEERRRRSKENSTVTTIANGSLEWQEFVPTPQKRSRKKRGSSSKSPRKPKKKGKKWIYHWRFNGFFVVPSALDCLKDNIFTPDLSQYWLTCGVIFIGESKQSISAYKIRLEGEKY
jgi:hypothetical protein